MCVAGWHGDVLNCSLSTIAHGVPIVSFHRSPTACCAACAANAACFGWTYHADHAGECLLTATPRSATGNPATKFATCGCRRKDCGAAPPHPPHPPPACKPVWRPAPPVLKPLPAGTARPHLVSIIVDDLGYDDTSINGNTGITFTPRIQALMVQGLQHHFGPCLTYISALR